MSHSDSNFPNKSLPYTRVVSVITTLATAALWLIRDRDFESLLEFLPALLAVITLIVDHYGPRTLTKIDKVLALIIFVGAVALLRDMIAKMDHPQEGIIVQVTTGSKSPRETPTSTHTPIPSATPVSSATPTGTPSATATATPTATNTPTVTPFPPEGVIEFVFDLSYSMNITIPALGGRTFYSLTVETLLNRDFNLIDTPLDAVGLRTFGDGSCAEQERYMPPRIQPATGMGVAVLEEIQRLKPSSNRLDSRSAIMETSRWASVDVDNVAITSEKRTIIIYSDGIDNCFNRVISESNDPRQAVQELALVEDWAMEFEERVKNAQQREQINIEAYFFVYLLDSSEMPLYCRYIIDVKPENMYCTPIRIPESADVDKLIEQGIENLSDIYCLNHNYLCPTPTVTPTSTPTFIAPPTLTLTALPTPMPTATSSITPTPQKTFTPTPISTLPNPSSANTLTAVIIVLSVVGIILLIVLVVVIAAPFVIGLTVYAIKDSDD